MQSKKGGLYLRSLASNLPVSGITVGELKELIREVVREELDKLYLDEMDLILDSPEILADLEKLKQQKEKGTLVLLSRKEAFGDNRRI